MKDNYKTFEDLEFLPWGHDRKIPIPPMFEGAKQARLTFSNGYGVSVLFGNAFYSNGINNYELAVFQGNSLVYPPEICPNDDVLGYLPKEKVTEAMIKIQQL